LIEKGKMILKFKKDGKDMLAELMNSNGKSFLFLGSEVKKITTKLENSSMAEVSDAVNDQKVKKSIEVNPKVFEVLRRELGDFEIIL
jgi:hypothetical protein